MIRRAEAFRALQSSRPPKPRRQQSATGGGACRDTTEVAAFGPDSYLTARQAAPARSIRERVSILGALTLRGEGPHQLPLPICPRRARPRWRSGRAERAGVERTPSALLIGLAPRRDGLRKEPEARKGRVPRAIGLTRGWPGLSPGNLYAASGQFDPCLSVDAAHAALGSRRLRSAGAGTGETEGGRRRDTHSFMDIPVFLGRRQKIPGRVVVPRVRQTEDRIATG